MSNFQSAADELDDYTVQQENELEALASIFGDDFEDVRKNHPWKIKRPPEVFLTLSPKGLNNGQESYVKVDLQVKCPPTYPDVPPEFELKNAKGLSNDNLQNLQSELTKLAANLCGEVMIYELADFVQGFLSEHNVPPPRSFHEEMLKNQRRQQEKLAQEQQQKIDQQRKQEEQMVGPRHPPIAICFPASLALNSCLTGVLTLHSHQKQQIDAGCPGCLRHITCYC